MGADVSESQLSGSLLLDVAGWWEVLKVYYLYTLLALTLPVGTLLLWLLPQLKQLKDNTDRFGQLMLIGMGTILVATLGGNTESITSSRCCRSPPSSSPACCLDAHRRPSGLVSNRWSMCRQ